MFYRPWTQKILNQILQLMLTLLKHPEKNAFWMCYFICLLSICGCQNNSVPEAPAASGWPSLKKKGGETGREGGKGDGRKQQDRRREGGRGREVEKQSNPWPHVPLTPTQTHTLGFMGQGLVTSHSCVMELRCFLLCYCVCVWMRMDEGHDTSSREI